MDVTNELPLEYFSVGGARIIDTNKHLNTRLGDDCPIF